MFYGGHTIYAALRLRCCLEWDERGFGYGLIMHGITQYIHNMFDRLGEIYL